MLSCIGVLSKMRGKRHDTDGMAITSFLSHLFCFRDLIWYFSLLVLAVRISVIYYNNLLNKTAMVPEFVGGCSEKKDDKNDPFRISILLAESPILGEKVGFKNIRKYSIPRSKFYQFQLK